MIRHRERSYWANGSDRLLAGKRFVAAFGELDMPPVWALNEALTAIAEAGPHTRVRLAPDAARMRWRTDSTVPVAYPIPAVIENRGVPAILEYLRNRSGRRDPLEVFTSRRHIFFDIDHGLGDGRFALELMSALFSLTSGIRPGWIDKPETALALPHAILREFLGRPSNAWPALTAALTLRHNRTEHLADDESTVPWQPSFALGMAHIDATSEDAVAQWRRSHPNQPGGAAVWLYIVREAFQAAGVDLPDHVMFAFDSRRYLRTGQTVNRNFSIGLPLSFRRSETLPEFDSRLRRIISAGVPLAGQAAISGRALVGPRQIPEAPSRRSITAPIDVMYSDLGRITMLDAAPWRDSQVRLVTGLLDPATPHSVTILNAAAGATRNIAISYHDNVFDRQLVERAVGYISEPLQFLEFQRADRTVL